MYITSHPRLSKALAGGVPLGKFLNIFCASVFSCGKQDSQGPPHWGCMVCIA